jgi:PAS domain S-box-containing protein
MEQQARPVTDQSDRYGRRLAFLVEASRLLSSSLDYQETLQSISRLTVEHMATLCLVDLISPEGKIVRMKAAHRDPQMEPWIHLLQERYPPDPNRPHPALRVVRTRRPEYLAEIPDSLVEAVAQNAEHARIIRELGFKSAMVVPLVVREKVLGALSLVRDDSQPRYTAEDLAVAEELGRTAAIAVENAQLYAAMQQALKDRDAALALAEEQRSRLYSLFLQVPAIICHMRGPDHLVEFVNERWIQATGRRNVIGQSISVLFPELVAQGILELFDRVYTTGETVLRVERPVEIDREGKGTPVQGFYSFVCQPTLDAYGHVDGVFVHAVEVTEQVQARQKVEELAVSLQTKAERQAALAALGEQAVRDRDLSLLMQAVVTTTARVLAVPLCKVLELLPDGTALLLKAGVGWQSGVVGQATVGAGIDSQAGYTLLADGPVVVRDLSQETRFRGPRLLIDHRVVSGISVRIQGAERPLGVLGAHTTVPREFTVEDMHFLQAVAHVLGAAIERKKSEDALRLSEQRLRLALAAGRMGTWDWDLTTGKVVWSLGVETLHGLEQGTLEGGYEAAFRGLHPADGPGLEEAVHRALSDRNELDAEYRILTPDGEVRWLHGRARVITDDEGVPVRMIGICLDITDRKSAQDAVLRWNAELERRVDQRTKDLQSAISELEAFSYSVSHDLRTPLRTIDGFSQALLEDFGSRLDMTGRDYLQRVRAASQRMGDLIDDLLQLSRVSRVELKRETVNLSSQAGEVVAALRRAEPGRDVTVEIEDGIVVEGDGRLLRLALENLLDNAWKFTRHSKEARIEFRASQEEGRTLYLVRDNGAGFDMAHAAKLFGPFQRLHSASEFEGNGIGLATVRRIVQRHGGEIWAESAVERGATFFFTLH